MTPFRTYKINQLIAFLTLSVFCVTGLQYPSAFASAPPAVPAVNSYQPLEVLSLNLPKVLGTVEDSWKGKTSETVLILQDAHSNPEAQKKLQKLIRYFQKNFAIRKVGVEGSAGSFDTQILKSFPDQKQLKQILKGSLEKGELTAAASAALFPGKDFSETEFYGIEDWALYEKGLAIYLRAADFQAEIQNITARWQKDLQARKQSIYSPELLEIDRLLEEFALHPKNLMEVLEKLAAIRKPEAGTEPALLLAEHYQGTADPKILEAEVKDLIEKYRPLLEKRLQNPRRKQKCLDLQEKAQKFLTSQISPQSMALALQREWETLPETARAAFTMSDALKGKVEDQKRIEAIDGLRFFSAFREYSDSVKNSLLETDEARELDRESRFRFLVGKLARVELSREEWKEFELLSSREKSDSEKQYLNKAAGPLRFARAFYENAEQRDAAFLKNLLGHAAGESSLLIAGGFHAHGMAEHLKGRGISYAVILPALADLPDADLYQAHMRGNVSWRDYFEIENGKISVYKAFVRYLRDQLLAASGISSQATLKLWRDQIIRDLAGKNQTGKAGVYTKFLDETIQKDGTGYSEAMRRLNRFLDGIFRLEKEDRISKQNIYDLLRLSKIAAAGSSAAESPDSPVQASLLGFGALPDERELLAFSAERFAMRAETRSESQETSGADYILSENANLLLDHSQRFLASREGIRNLLIAMARQKGWLPGMALPPEAGNKIKSLFITYFGESGTWGGRWTTPLAELPAFQSSQSYDFSNIMKLMLVEVPEKSNLESVAIPIYRSVPNGLKALQEKAVTEEMMQHAMELFLDAYLFSELTRFEMYIRKYPGASDAARLPLLEKVKMLKENFKMRPSGWRAYEFSRAALLDSSLDRDEPALVSRQLVYVGLEKEIPQKMDLEKIKLAVKFSIRIARHLRAVLLRRTDAGAGGPEALTFKPMNQDDSVRYNGVDFSLLTAYAVLLMQAYGLTREHPEAAVLHQELAEALYSLFSSAPEVFLNPDELFDIHTRKGPAFPADRNFFPVDLPFFIKEGYEQLLKANAAELLRDVQTNTAVQESRLHGGHFGSTAVLGAEIEAAAVVYAVQHPEINENLFEKYHRPLSGLDQAAREQHWKWVREFDPVVTQLLGSAKEKGNTIPRADFAYQETLKEMKLLAARSETRQKYPVSIGAQQVEMLLTAKNAQLIQRLADRRDGVDVVAGNITAAGRIEHSSGRLVDPDLLFWYLDNLPALLEKLPEDKIYYFYHDLKINLMYLLKREGTLGALFENEEGLLDFVSVIYLKILSAQNEIEKAASSKRFPDVTMQHNRISSSDLGLMMLEDWKDFLVWNLDRRFDFAEIRVEPGDYFEGIIYRAAGSLKPLLPKISALIQRMKQVRRDFNSVTDNRFAVFVQDDGYLYRQQPAEVRSQVTATEESGLQRRYLEIESHLTAALSPKTELREAFWTDTAAALEKRTKSAQKIYYHGSLTRPGFQGREINDSWEFILSFLDRIAKEKEAFKEWAFILDSGFSLGQIKNTMPPLRDVAWDKFNEDVSSFLNSSADQSVRGWFHLKMPDTEIPDYTNRALDILDRLHQLRMKHSAHITFILPAANYQRIRMPGPMAEEGTKQLSEWAKLPQKGIVFGYIEDHQHVSDALGSYDDPKIVRIHHDLTQWSDPYAFASQYDETGQLFATGEGFRDLWIRYAVHQLAKTEGWGNHHTVGLSAADIRGDLQQFQSDFRTDPIAAGIAENVLESHFDAFVFTKLPKPDDDDDRDAFEEPAPDSPDAEISPSDLYELSHRDEARTEEAVIPAAIVPSAALSPLSEGQVEREFGKLVDSGVEFKVPGSFRGDPKSLLSSGYTPKFKIELFDTAYYMTRLRHDGDEKVLAAYVVQKNPKTGKPVIYARLFYKDYSMIWRSPSHFQGSEAGVDWFGKGDFEPYSRSADGIKYSMEETTNLPLEIQTALDQIGTTPGIPKIDTKLASRIVRGSLRNRPAPYTDFTAQRKAAKENPKNLINKNKRIAYFTQRNDPSTLKFVKGYEPDFQSGIIEVSVDKGTRTDYYGGPLTKYRILSANRKVQYQFIAGRNHFWLNPPQALTTQLTTYGSRSVDVMADYDLFLPGFEYHYEDDDGSIYSQIPPGFAGKSNPHFDPVADASKWHAQLPVIQQFKRVVVSRGIKKPNYSAARSEMRGNDYELSLRHRLRQERPNVHSFIRSQYVEEKPGLLKLSVGPEALYIISAASKGKEKEIGIPGDALDQGRVIYQEKSAELEYSMHTELAILMMLRHAKEIRGHDFVDLGHGKSAILTIAALKLGAEKVYSVDGDSGTIPAFNESLKLNHVPQDHVHQITARFSEGEAKILPELSGMDSFPVIIANVGVNSLPILLGSFVPAVRKMDKEPLYLFAGGKIASHSSDDEDPDDDFYHYYDVMISRFADGFTDTEGTMLRISEDGIIQSFGLSTRVQPVRAEARYRGELPKESPVPPSPEISPSTLRILPIKVKGRADWFTESLPEVLVRAIELHPETLRADGSNIVHLHVELPPNAGLNSLQDFDFPKGYRLKKGDSLTYLPAGSSFVLTYLPKEEPKKEVSAKPVKKTAEKIPVKKAAASTPAAKTVSKEVYLRRQMLHRILQQVEPGAPKLTFYDLLLRVREQSGTHYASATIRRDLEEDKGDPHISRGPLKEHPNLNLRSETRDDFTRFQDSDVYTLGVNPLIQETEQWIRVGVTKENSFYLMRASDIGKEKQFDIPEQALDRVLYLPEKKLAYGHHTALALYLMLLNEDRIKGHTVIDLGHGKDGIVTLAAYKLKAKRVFAVELDGDAFRAFPDSMKRNDIPEDFYVQKAGFFEDVIPEIVAELGSERDPVFISDLPAGITIELFSKWLVPVYQSRGLAPFFIAAGAAFKNSTSIEPGEESRALVNLAVGFSLKDEASKVLTEVHGYNVRRDEDSDELASSIAFTARQIPLEQRVTDRREARKIKKEETPAGAAQLSDFYESLPGAAPSSGIPASLAVDADRRARLAGKLPPYYEANWEKTEQKLGEIQAALKVDAPSLLTYFESFPYLLTYSTDNFKAKWKILERIKAQKNFTNLDLILRLNTELLGVVITAAEGQRKTLVPEDLRRLSEKLEREWWRRQTVRPRLTAKKKIEEVRAGHDSSEQRYEQNIQADLQKTFAPALQNLFRSEARKVTREELDEFVKKVNETQKQLPGDFARIQVGYKFQTMEEMRQYWARSGAGLDDDVVRMVLQAYEAKGFSLGEETYSGEIRTVYLIDPDSENFKFSSLLEFITRSINVRSNVYDERDTDSAIRAIQKRMGVPISKPARILGLEQISAWQTLAEDYRVKDLQRFETRSVEGFEQRERETADSSRREMLLTEVNDYFTEVESLWRKAAEQSKETLEESLDRLRTVQRKLQLVKPGSLPSENEGPMYLGIEKTGKLIPVRELSADTLGPLQTPRALALFLNQLGRIRPDAVTGQGILSFELSEAGREFLWDLSKMTLLNQVSRETFSNLDGRIFNTRAYLLFEEKSIEAKTYRIPYALIFGDENNAVILNFSEMTDISGELTKILGIPASVYAQQAVRAAKTLKPQANLVGQFRVMHNAEVNITENSAEWVRHDAAVTRGLKPKDRLNIFSVTSSDAQEVWMDDVMSPGHEYSQDFQRLIKLFSGAGSFRGKVVGIGGLGSAVDLLLSIRYGAKKVYGTEPFMLAYLMSLVNVELARELKQIPENFPVEIRRQKGIPKDPDIQMVLFNLPGVKDKPVPYFKTVAEQSRVPVFAAVQIDSATLESILKDIGEVLRLDPNRIALVRIDDGKRIFSQDVQLQAELMNEHLRPFGLGVGMFLGGAFYALRSARAEERPNSENEMILPGTEPSNVLRSEARSTQFKWKNIAVYTELSTQQSVLYKGAADTAGQLAAVRKALTNFFDQQDKYKIGEYARDRRTLSIQGVNIRFYPQDQFTGFTINGGDITGSIEVPYARRDEARRYERLEDFIIATALLMHGGPVNIVDTVSRLNEKMRGLFVDALNLSGQDKEKFLADLKALKKIVDWDYFNDLTGYASGWSYSYGREIAIANGSKRTFVLKKPLELPSEEFLELKRQQYIKWLKDTAVLFEQLLAMKQKFGPLSEEGEAIWKEFEDFAKRNIEINLDAARFYLESDESPLDFQPLELNQWLKTQVWMTKAKSVSSRLQVNEENYLRFNPASDPVSVRVNAPLLHLALERFISNAFHELMREKVLPEDQKVVRIKTARGEDGTAQIIFLNPGTLPEESLEMDSEQGIQKIFAYKFIRRSYAGGIGGTFAARAVQRMNGRMKAENVIEGGIPQVRITVSFPAAVESVSSPAVSVSAKMRSNPSSKVPAVLRSESREEASMQPAEMEKVRAFVTDGFADIFKKVGTSDSEAIRAMDRLEFARLLGHQEIPLESLWQDPALGSATGFLFGAPFFTIGPALWTEILEERNQPDKKRNVITRLLAALPEVQGAGSFFISNLIWNFEGLLSIFSGSTVQINAATFVHEDLEMRAMNSGFVDEAYKHLVQDAHFTVLFGELIFAAVLGQKALENDRALLKHKIEVTSDDERRRPLPERARILAELQWLYDYSLTDAFTEEALHLWREAALRSENRDGEALGIDPRKRRVDFSTDDSAQWNEPVPAGKGLEGILRVSLPQNDQGSAAVLGRDPSPRPWRLRLLIRSAAFILRTAILNGLTLGTLLIHAAAGGKFPFWSYLVFAFPSGFLLFVLVDSTRVYLESLGKDAGQKKSAKTDAELKEKALQLFSDLKDIASRHNDTALLRALSRLQYFDLLDQEDYDLVWDGGKSYNPNVIYFPKTWFSVPSLAPARYIAVRRLIGMDYDLQVKEDASRNSRIKKLTESSKFESIKLAFWRIYGEEELLQFSRAWRYGYFFLLPYLSFIQAIGSISSAAVVLLISAVSDFSQTRRTLSYLYSRFVLKKELEISPETPGSMRIVPQESGDFSSRFESRESIPYAVTLIRKESGNWEAVREADGLRTSFTMSSPVRRLTQEQWLEYKKLAADIFEEEPLSESQKLDNPDHYYGLLFHGEHVVGYYDYLIKENLIDTMKVHPDFRGTGAVDILLEDFRESLNRIGVSTFHAQVIRHSPRARTGHAMVTVDELKQRLGILSVVTLRDARKEARQLGSRRREVIADPLERWLRREMPRLFIPPAGEREISWLDLGSGTGIFIPQWNERLENLGFPKEKITGYGVEASDLYAIAAQQINGLPVLYGDAGDYPSLRLQHPKELPADLFFDLVIISAPDIHAIDFKAFLETAFHFLKPDGRVLIRLFTYEDASPGQKPRTKDQAGKRREQDKERLAVIKMLEKNRYFDTEYGITSETAKLELPMGNHEVGALISLKKKPAVIKPSLSAAANINGKKAGPSPRRISRSEAREFEWVKENEEFKRWHDSGNEDVQILQQILTSDSNEAFMTLARKYPKKISVAYYEQTDPTEGRTVYLKLSSPIGKIHHLRIKAARPRTAEDGVTVLPYPGKRGFTAPIMLPGDNGEIGFQDGGIGPFGGMAIDDAVKEYDFMEYSLFKNRGYNTDKAMAVGLYHHLHYPDNKGHDHRLGFMIAGMIHADHRFGIYQRQGGDPLAYLGVIHFGSGGGARLSAKNTLSAIEKLGGVLRKLHDDGYAHRYPHLNNFGVYVASHQKIHVILRDLNNIFRFKGEPEAVQAAWRFTDFARMRQYLGKYGEHVKVTDEMMEAFTRGYFRAELTGGPEDTALFQSIINPDFYNFILSQRDANAVFRPSEIPQYQPLWNFLIKTAVRAETRDNLIQHAEKILGQPFQSELLNRDAVEFRFSDTHALAFDMLPINDHTGEVLAPEIRQMEAVNTRLREAKGAEVMKGRSVLLTLTYATPDLAHIALSPGLYELQGHILELNHARLARQAGFQEVPFGYTAAAFDRETHEALLRPDLRLMDSRAPNAREAMRAEIILTARLIQTIAKGLGDIQDFRVQIGFGSEENLAGRIFSPAEQQKLDRKIDNHGWERFSLQQVAALNYEAPHFMDRERWLNATQPAFKQIAAILYDWIKEKKISDNTFETRALGLEQEIERGDFSNALDAVRRLSKAIANKGLTVGLSAEDIAAVAPILDSLNTHLAVLEVSARAEKRNWKKELYQNAVTLSWVFVLATGAWAFVKFLQWVQMPQWIVIGWSILFPVLFVFIAIDYWLYGRVKKDLPSDEGIDFDRIKPYSDPDLTHFLDMSRTVIVQLEEVLTGGDSQDEIGAFNQSDEEIELGALIRNLRQLKQLASPLVRDEKEVMQMIADLPFDTLSDEVRTKISGSTDQIWENFSDIEDLWSKIKTRVDRRGTRAEQRSELKESEAREKLQGLAPRLGRYFYEMAASDNDLQEIAGESEKVIITVGSGEFASAVRTSLSDQFESVRKTQPLPASGKTQLRVNETLARRIGSQILENFVRTQRDTESLAVAFHRPGREKMLEEVLGQDEVKGFLSLAFISKEMNEIHVEGLNVQKVRVESLGLRPNRTAQNSLIAVLTENEIPDRPYSYAVRQSGTAVEGEPFFDTLMELIDILAAAVVSSSEGVNSKKDLKDPAVQKRVKAELLSRLFGEGFLKDRMPEGVFSFDEEGNVRTDRGLFMKLMTEAIAARKMDISA